MIKKYSDLRKKIVEKKLTEDEIKVLAENELEFTKYVPPNHVQFIKQVPLHSRERLKRTLAAKIKKNKKVLPPIHPRERLKQKVAKDSSTSSIPVHPTDRLFKREKYLKAEKMDLQVTKYVPGNVQLLKQQPLHPRYRTRFKLQNNRQRP